MNKPVEKLESIEKRINSLSYTDPEEIQQDIDALTWQKELYEHMHEKMSLSKKLRNSDALDEIQEAIADIEDLIASAQEKLTPGYEREFQVN